MFVILISLMMGVFFYIGLDFIIMLVLFFRIKMEDNISFGFMALYIVLLMVFRFISRYVMILIFNLICKDVCKILDKLYYFSR